LEVKEVVTRQVGLMTKGGGLDIAAWIQKEKEANPAIIVKEFPGHVEFHVEEKDKKKI